VNVFKILFLTLIFAMGFLFLFQNAHVLDTRASLILDLWWVKYSSPEVVFYVFVFVCFVFGIVFGALTFFPGNKELRKNLKLLRIKIKNLTQEVTAMHKKEEIPEEKSQEEMDSRPEEAEEPRLEAEKEPGPAPESKDPPKYAPFDQEVVVKTGEASGKAALIGVFAVFILLVAFYFYIDQKISEFQSHMDLSIEKSELAAELVQKVQQESEGFKEDLSAFSSSLREQEKELSALKSLPQDTMDYLTLMLINDYMAGIDQLTQRAATDEDKEMLEAVRDSLARALKHYTEKVD
jgi:uncharacterized membrane protein YgaE (UPF0421/DUF939 family)